MQKTRKAKEQRPAPNHGNEFFEQTHSDPSKSAGSFNQLGGFYVNGKPLNLKLRLHIIHLATMGMRACDISKYLKVSHGCVSKIITRYKETGSVNPGFIGGSKPKVATPEVVSKVSDYRTRFPGIFGWEIRGKLIEDKICETKNIPSISSINRIVRTLENKDNALLSELDPTLSYSSFQEHSFSSSISPPPNPVEHQFQSPKYSHPLPPEDYLHAPHKTDSTKFPSSGTHYTPETTNRNNSHKFAPATPEDDLVKPPCKYSTFLSTPHRGAKAPTAPHHSPDKFCPDSSSNSSAEGFLPLPQNWSNSTQDSGIWSDMSDSLTHASPVSSYRMASGYKRKLSFSGLTDFPHSQPPAKRTLKPSPSKLSTTLTHSSKNSRKRARKTAGQEEGLVSLTKSDKRTHGGYRSQVHVKQESQLTNPNYSNLHSRGYSLPSPPQLSQSSHLYASLSRHLIPAPEPVPLDGSSLLYPCSSLGDSAPWTHTDLLPSLYNTPSPPNFIDMGYSSNSNFSQSSSKLETSQLSGPTSYFYPPMGQCQDTDSLWTVPTPINSCYESQDAMCQIPESFKPLPCSPPYLSSCTQYPSPDSTSATGPHPFYASARMPASLFQQQQRAIGTQEEMLRMGALSSQSLSDLIEASSHSLPTVTMDKLTEAAVTVHQDLTLSPLLFPDVDSISPQTHSPANTKVLNDPLPPTCSYPLPTDPIQTGLTDSNFFQLEATDITNYYSGNLDDSGFKN